MVDAVDDVVDARRGDPLAHDRVLGLSIGLPWLQVVALSSRRVDTAPGTVSRVRVLLVALGEVEMTSNGRRFAVFNWAGTIANVLRLSFGIKCFLKAVFVDFGAPGGGEPGLLDDEVGRVGGKLFDRTHYIPGT